MSHIIGVVHEYCFRILGVIVILLHIIGMVENTYEYKHV